jgi:hypothetical protein
MAPTRRAAALAAALTAAAPLLRGRGGLGALPLLGFGIAAEERALLRAAFPLIEAEAPWGGETLHAAALARHRRGWFSGLFGTLPPGDPAPVLGQAARVLAPGGLCMLLAETEPSEALDALRAAGFEAALHVEAWEGREWLVARRGLDPSVLPGGVEPPPPQASALPGAAADDALGMLAVLQAGLPGRPMLPYEAFDTAPIHLFPDLRDQVDGIIEAGWEMAGMRIPSIAPPVAWAAHNRSFCFHLHGWEPCTYLLHGHTAFGDRRMLEAAFDFAWDWIARFQLPHLGIEEDDAALDDLLRRPGDFAWYDMAVAQRLYRLAYIVEALVRAGFDSAPHLAVLWRTLRFHHRALAREHFFRLQSNHGIYQALGQLAAARRFGWLAEAAPFAALGTARLRQLIDAHFFASGVHREHSPGYHFMLLASLLGAITSGLLDDADLIARIRGLEEALTWMIGPDLQLATIGDTDPRRMRKTPALGLLHQHPVLQWQVGGPEIGTPPPPGIKAYPDAGYAFARLGDAAAPEDPAAASWFAQFAGFHSRVHKHADHFTFLWHEGGRRVLTDPGRFAYLGRTELGSALFNQGFWYADPRRIYVESTRAHNAVEIDGRSYNRRVPPFGSALIQAEMQDGCFVTACAATHFRSIRHWRGVVLSPRRFLLVLDWLQDRSDTPHAYRQWFTFDPAWQARLEGGVLHAEAGEGPGGAAAQQLRAASLLPGAALRPPLCGQQAPELQGWVSTAANVLTPAPSFHSLAEGSGPQLLATVFALGDTLEPDAGSRANASLSRGRLAWRDARGRCTLELERDRDGRLRLAGGG